jgi:hypothetical protein
MRKHVTALDERRTGESMQKETKGISLETGRAIIAFALIMGAAILLLVFARVFLN